MVETAKDRVDHKPRTKSIWQRSVKSMEAAIIRFHRANEIRCYETVSYPTMLILPNIFF